MERLENIMVDKKEVEEMLKKFRKEFPFKQDLRVFYLFTFLIGIIIILLIINVIFIW